ARPDECRPGEAAGGPAGRSAPDARRDLQLVHRGVRHRRSARGEGVAREALREARVRYYDISLNLSPDTVRWVVAPPLEVHERRRISRGDDVNATALTVSVHAGTHVDAPFHFLPDGAAIDSVPLERFMGPALVHQVDADRFITEAHVKA